MHLRRPDGMKERLAQAKVRSPGRPVRRRRRFAESAQQAMLGQDRRHPFVRRAAWADSASGSISSESGRRTMPDTYFGRGVLRFGGWHQVTADEAAHRQLLNAIASGDDMAVFGLLSASPDLARAPVEDGATRTAAREHYLTEIECSVYAGDTALHIAAAAYRPDSSKADQHGHRRPRQEPARSGATSLRGCRHTRVTHVESRCAVGDRRVLDRSRR